jgi:PadR family transcriptional regulator
MRLVSLPSGSLYPLLYALEDAGLLSSRWESEEPPELRRPRRRLYKLTELGERQALEAVAELSGLTRPTEAPELT